MQALQWLSPTLSLRQAGDLVLGCGNADITGLTAVHGLIPAQTASPLLHPAPISVFSKGVLTFSRNQIGPIAFTV